mmetsp:Transcript_32605/g.76542  ORF Transcript_32605/g.76542 Transcript_32605/m.76542 type:complete len:238 (+) Transcript_32605:1321-2034(+)
MEPDAAGAEHQLRRPRHRRAECRHHGLHRGRGVAQQVDGGVHRDPADLRRLQLPVDRAVLPEPGHAAACLLPPAKRHRRRSRCVRPEQTRAHPLALPALRPAPAGNHHRHVARAGGYRRPVRRLGLQAGRVRCAERGQHGLRRRQYADQQAHRRDGYRQDQPLFAARPVADGGGDAAHRRRQCPRPEPVRRQGQRHAARWRDVQGGVRPARRQGCSRRGLRRAARELPLHQRPAHQH